MDEATSGLKTWQTQSHFLVPYQASPISHHFSRCFPLFLGFTFRTTREKIVARLNQRLRCPPADGPSFTKRSDCGARCGKVHSDVLKKGSAKIPICAFNWGNLHKSCHMAPLPFQSFPPFHFLFFFVCVPLHPRPKAFRVSSAKGRIYLSQPTLVYGLRD